MSAAAPSNAVCNDCGAELICSKSSRNYSTSPLINHLRVKHPKLFKEYEELMKPTAETHSFQASHFQNEPQSSKSHPTLPNMWDKTKMLSGDCKRSVDITNSIAEMIGLDMQPYSIVENPGFLQIMNVVEPRYTMPSKKYFTTRAVGA